ncbi:MAG: Coq4 family protein [Parvularculaceae bacterium]
MNARIDADGMSYEEAMSGKIRPLKALRAFRRLAADKDDTGQVVVFKNALDGPWYETLFEEFKADPEGARILARGTDVFDVIKDEAYLKGLPEGSLGREFYEQMRAEGISPQGFRDVNKDGQDFSEFRPELRLVHQRHEDIHDLLHALVGWGRDILGELCILEYQGIQYRSRGLRLLSYFGAAEAKRRVPSSPVFACIREATRIARSMRWMLTYDWEANLHRPMEDVRRETGVTPPTRYLAIRDEWIRHDADMRDVAAAKKAAAAA